MANMWLRLWHEMPNDPKFRTVARISKQPISLVLSVYLHLLVDASRNVTRGHVTVTDEDLASALDVDEPQISSIFDAMEGRLKKGDLLTGWEDRQVAKEDSGDKTTGAKSAAERKREERERKKNQSVTTSHDESRQVTTDKDKDKEETIKVKPHVELKPDLDVSEVGQQVKVVKSAKQESVSMDQVHDVFEYWKKIMDSPRSILDDKRKKRIAKALGVFESDDLLRAIRGCRNSPFHMGNNDRKTRYNGIAVIFRDAEQVEHFIAKDNGTVSVPVNETAEERNERISREFLRGDDDENTIDV